MLSHALTYYGERALVCLDYLLEFRNDPTSYLYYYHERYLEELQELERSTGVPFTVIKV